MQWPSLWCCITHYKLTRGWTIADPPSLCSVVCPWIDKGLFFRGLFFILFNVHEPFLRTSLEDKTGLNLLSRRPINKLESSDTHSFYSDSIPFCPIAFLLFHINNWHVSGFCFCFFSVFSQLFHFPYPVYFPFVFLDIPSILTLYRIPFSN